MIPIILLKAFEVYEAKNQTDLVPRHGPGVAVIGSAAFGGPEKSSHFKIPQGWASVCEFAMPGWEGIRALVKETQMSWFSCFSLPTPKASPGPGAEGSEFLGVGAREVELGVTPPPSAPQCFRIQGQDPQDRVKWSEAQFSCEQQEAQLVTIANPLEQGRVSPGGGPRIL